MYTFGSSYWLSLADVARLRCRLSWAEPSSGNTVQPISITNMAENVGNVPYRLRRRPLRWDDDPDRHSRQSQKYKNIVM